MRTLIIAGLLFLSSSSVAFVPPSRMIIGQKNNERCPLTAVQPTSNEDEENDVYNFNTSEYNGADSIRRRRLVLSLLGASASFPLAAYAITKDNTPYTPNVANAAVAEAATPINILKPPLDKRTYETYTLPNGLKVLLCSDPASTTSAVAMNVHVGACSDPVEIPGLAHFCEHMLFLGTDRYPEEGSFSKFLSSNGEHTVFTLQFCISVLKIHLLIASLHRGNE